MKPRALILCLHLQRHFDRYRDLFERNGVEADLPEVVQQMSEAELLDIIAEYDGVVAGDDDFSAAVLEKGHPRLKVVSKWGVGMDAIDRTAAERLGIRVFNTPGAFADEVGDAVAGYLVLLARGLHLMDRSVREGNWRKIQGTTLRGKRLGVVGIGSIGRGVAVRARALGMLVSGYDPAGIPEGARSELGIEPVGIQELLAQSDFVSLNCPLTESNRHLLNGDAFSRMKDGVFVINTGRGPLIDEEALVAALRSGKVAGAALDVFEREPLPPESPLRGFENVIFGTHNASNTLEAVLRVNELAIANLFRGLGLEAFKP